MKILFDTNVILDVMLLRKPFYNAAVLLLAEVERNNIDGYICSTTVTTIYYLVAKTKGRKIALLQLGNLLKLFKIAVVDKTCLISALNSKITDYEDAVLHEAASQEKLDAIVTRNIKDFKQAQLTIYSPEELSKILKT
ncbi:MAG: PIN domain-containing protein [Calditrichaeota bacterium]|nr:MAG: PIN domain-containing protein [Calditrichota bacterium]